MGCVESLICPGSFVSTPALQYYCYRWKASETKKTGVLGFNLKDNHGGNSDLLQFNLNASDRNQKPCMRPINNSSGAILSLSIPNYSYVIKADDNDFDVPMISITSNQAIGSSDVYPFLYDSFTNKNINGLEVGQKIALACRENQPN